MFVDYKYSTDCLSLKKVWEADQDDKLRMSWQMLLFGCRHVDRRAVARRHKPVTKARQSRMQHVQNTAKEVLTIS